MLKVGKVGANSNPRFQYQHYKSNSAKSTLAGRILTHQILWNYLGIGEVTQNSIEKWLKQNTDRDHFFIEGTHGAVRDALEVYLKGLLGPVFEG